MAGRQNESSETPQPNAAVTLTFEQLKELLASNKPSQDEQIALLEKQAELNAKAHRDLNPQHDKPHPGISVFSRPEGELANPKGDFGYKATWAGTTCRPEQLTAEEFDLFRELPSGIYRCTRADNSLFEVTVEVQMNNITGKIERKDVRFKTAGGLRHNLPSMVSMMRDMIAQAAASSAVPPVGLHR